MAKAKQLLRRAFSIRERVLGPAHPAVATTLEHYAALLRSSGRHEEAARTEARARRIREEDQVRQAPRP